MKFQQKQKAQTDQKRFWVRQKQGKQTQEPHIHTHTENDYEVGEVQSEQPLEQTEASIRKKQG